MKGFLLDTHVLIWEVTDDPKTPETFRAILHRKANVHVSTVSVWEIAIKSGLRKLSIPGDLLGTLEKRGINILPITPVHALAVADLPLHHRDPFDRLLIAQARLEDLVLLSVDRRFPLYDVAIAPHP